MSAGLQVLAADGTPVTVVALGEVDAENGEAAVGEQCAYLLANTGTTIFQGLAVAVDGPGADFIALAVDVDGEPGIWAEPGREIVPAPNTLRPGERTRIWAQAVFGPDDLEAAYEFNLRISAQSIAQNTGIPAP